MSLLAQHTGQPPPGRELADLCTVPSNGGPRRGRSVSPGGHGSQAPAPQTAARGARRAPAPHLRSGPGLRGPAPGAGSAPEAGTRAALTGDVTVQVLPGLNPLGRKTPGRPLPLEPEGGPRGIPVPAPASPPTGGPPGPLCPLGPPHPRQPAPPHTSRTAASGPELPGPPAAPVTRLAASTPGRSLWPRTGWCICTCVPPAPD